MKMLAKFSEFRKNLSIELIDKEIEVVSKHLILLNILKNKLGKSLNSSIIKPYVKKFLKRKLTHLKQAKDNFIKK